MPTTKSFLALKGVRTDGTSCFVSNPALKTRYVVGERIRSRSEIFPFYVATFDEIQDYTPSQMSIDTTYDKILLVSVLAKDLRSQAPWNDCTGSAFDEKDLQKVTTHFNRSFVTATSLRVLETVPTGVNLKEYLQAQAKKRHQKILTRTLGMSIGKAIKP